MQSAQALPDPFNKLALQRFDRNYGPKKAGQLPGFLVNLRFSASVSSSTKRRRLLQQLPTLCRLR